MKPKISLTPVLLRRDLWGMEKNGGKPDPKAEREARLAQALRANLRRRKAVAAQPAAQAAAKDESSGR